MSAYAVVGPTNRNPRRFSSFASAVDSGVFAGISAELRGRGRGGGANDHSSAASPSGWSAAARALATAASILDRLRTIPWSASSRSTSAGPNAATASMANPANAARNASRFRRIVSHDSPDWNASRVSRSNSPSSVRTGRPHSVSWYAT